MGFPLEDQTRSKLSAYVSKRSPRCLADGGPIQLMTSWRRFGVSQQAADHVRETVVVRPASLGEINSLGLPSRGSVIAITRTCFAAGKPCETADIVLRSDRCELRYELGER